MDENRSDIQKPKRLYFKTYLKMIENAPGTGMFRNFFMENADQTEFDALDDGDNSCAFFVSSVLVLFKKIQSIHGTVDNTVEDMKASGWEQVTDMQPGDVLVWPERQKNRHIGFYVGNNEAVSTSSSKRAVARHNINFGEENRKPELIFRSLIWE